MPCPAGNVTRDLWSSYSAKKHLLHVFLPPDCSVSQDNPHLFDLLRWRRAETAAFALSLVALLISYNFAWKFNSGLTHAGIFPGGCCAGTTLQRKLL